MGDRLTTYTIHYSYVALLILLLPRGSSSLNLQGLALLDFQARISHDPFGAFANWNADDDDPCSWSHVHCVFGNVHALDLKLLSLEGVLSPELGNLTHLRRLILSHNHFSGVIPKELGELKMLEVLDLRDNNFIGKIPHEIETIQSLKFLLINDNNLEGTIPPEFEIFNLLYKLQFDDNLTFGVTDAIGLLNRKLGRCIWPGGFNHFRTVESLFIPFKEIIINYLKPFQLFSKGVTDNSCGNEENTCKPEIIQNVPTDGSAISRKLSEDPINLASSSSSRDFSTQGRIIAIPSTRSSGSFPATLKEVIKEEEELSPSSDNSTSTGESSKSESYSQMLVVMLGVTCGGFLVITCVSLLFICGNRKVKTIGPWKPRLNKQLRKAFVTGVQRLDRIELETACEDFSNIIETNDGCTLFKGILSSGVEICVAASTITRLKDWSKRAELAFHKKIEILSRVNHKNFVNLIGYCREDDPFVRMMVFEYTPNGLLSENLHFQEFEHLDWSKRMRIIMGVAYCIQYLHALDPPMEHMDLDSNMIYLTDDQAAKVADLRFWKEFYPKSKSSGANESIRQHSKETNIYSFGVFLLEIISKKHSYSKNQESLVTWAEKYLNEKENIKDMIDPELKSFKENELDVLCEVIQECVRKDASERPTIYEIIKKLRDVLGILPEHAIPRLSPLWWAELELLSSD